MSLHDIAGHRTPVGDSAPPEPPIDPPLGERGTRASAGLSGARLMLGPAAVGILAAAFTFGAGTPLESGLITFLIYAAPLLAMPETTHVRLLRFASRLIGVLPLLLSFAGLVAVQMETGLPGLSRFQMIGLLAVAVVASLLCGARRRGSPVRVAVIGSPALAEMLARELAVAGVAEYRVIGVLTTKPGDGAVGDLPVLGVLTDLRRTIEHYRIGLLLMTGEVPRLSVFDELVRSLDLPVRLWELSGFYEATFGHVPVGEINASWFQYIMHPKYRPSGGAAKRGLDLLVAGVVGILVAPLLAVLALAVKRDGGPALFRQQRIGEGGRSFPMLKLRTMRPSSETGAVWAAADDPRITRLGHFLRRTHLDELPQVINVLRGDMSLVGPRPEQPGFVERLETSIPFYSRRHLIKPGITGWAQVRCGYAGSNTGSAWKLCHDLYYLKHRSLGLDLAILAETLRTLVADRQYDVEPAGVAFILRPVLPAEDGGLSV